MDAVLAEIAAERRRQIEVECWTPGHDDTHDHGEMAAAAACYALSTTPVAESAVKYWPWNGEWWKPTGARRCLVKAAALIVAEIERIDRRHASSGL